MTELDTKKQKMIGKVPVYVNDLDKYIAEMYDTFGNLVLNHKSQIDYLYSVRDSNIYRVNAVSNIIKAMEHNLALMQNISVSLEQT